MVDFVYCLTNLLSFDIPLLYYCINLRFSIIFGVSSADIHLSFGISVSISPVTEVFSSNCFENFVILLAILSSIKSPVVSTVVYIAPFEAVLSASVADCLV